MAAMCGPVLRRGGGQLPDVAIAFYKIGQSFELPGVKIRQEIAADAPAIAAVTVAAFCDAAHSDGTEPRIIDALRRAGQLTVSLVAEQGGAIIGHVAISPVRLSGGEAGWYGLGPIAVAPAWQRQGVGARLMSQALADLRARRAAGCVVLGDPAFYARFGFSAQTALRLPGVPQAYFQALVFDGPLPTGSVAYAEAFSVAP